MSQKILSALSVLITVVAVVVILQTAPEPYLVERETSLPVVTVVKLQQRDVQPRRKLFGRFEPVKTSELKFEVSGRIEARYVEVGELVEKAGILFRVDDRDYRDTLAKARSEVDLVRAEIERDRQLLDFAGHKRQLQKKEVTRLESLVDKELATRSLLDAAKQQLINLQVEESRIRHSVSIANARLRLIVSELDQVDRKLQRTRLIAPFTGIVNRIEAEVGSYAISGQTAAVMVDVSQLDLLLHVDEEMTSGLKIGELIEISRPRTAGTTKNLWGTLVALQVVPDPETFTYEARVRVAADGLRAGMVAHAYLPEPARGSVITVPIGAVQYLDGRTYVFVVHDGTLKRVRVLLGTRVNNDVIVKSGLSTGLSVIAHDVDKLSDGQKVAVRQGVELIR